MQCLSGNGMSGNGTWSQNFEFFILENVGMDYLDSIDYKYI